jgi:hypothetical protein
VDARLVPLMGWTGCFPPGVVCKHCPAATPEAAHADEERTSPDFRVGSNAALSPRIYYVSSCLASELCRGRYLRPLCARRHMQRRKLHQYSITSSARASSVGEISRPIALAVLRLIMSSNFTGCSIGRSPGFSPLKILSMYEAARRYRSG